VKAKAPTERIAELGSVSSVSRSTMLCTGFVFDAIFFLISRKS